MHIFAWGGGTHPQKGRVGSPRCQKLQIYLYHFAKKGGLISTFKAKKGVNALLFRPEICVKVYILAKIWPVDKF